MSDASGHQTDPLKLSERLIAGAMGIGILGVALTIVITPPQRRVALAQCPDAAAGCIVRIDSDLTTFAAVLAAIGAAAVLVAVLGIRFNSVKVGGAEFGFRQKTRGLPEAAPEEVGETDAQAPAPIEPGADVVPINVNVQKGLGEVLHAVPVAVPQLTNRMRDVDPPFLRDYQSARKISQQSHFLTHILGPATRRGQKYSVAIRVTPHRDATSEVKSASFYLGRAWGNKTFEGKRGPDGLFGITTEAYGPFLALCEVEFYDGSRVLLDRYCDFDMGSLVHSYDR